MNKKLYYFGTPLMLLGLLVSGASYGLKAEKQAQLCYDDGQMESVFGIVQGAAVLVVDLKKLITCSSWWGKEKNRIAVAYESSFDKNKIVKVRVQLVSFKTEGAPHGEFEIQILDENWETVATRKIVTEDPGKLEVEFGDEDIFVKKTFAVALLPQNCKNIYVGLDSSSSGHSYVIFEGEKPKKIMEMEAGNQMKEFNDGVYEFMVQVTVEEIQEPREPRGTVHPRGTSPYPIATQ